MNAVPARPTTTTATTEAPSKAGDRARAYTAPGAAVRQAALLALGSTTTQGNDDPFGSAGPESVQAAINLNGALPIVGAPGLAPPTAGVANAVSSRPGLQQGPAAGLGAVGMFNVLNPQINPLSGPNGRCQDLVTAGFFNHDLASCQRHFSR